MNSDYVFCLCCLFFLKAEDGIRYLVRSRGLGDVYKRQGTFSGEDERKSYLQGLTFNRTLAQRAEQARLGWRAEITATRQKNGMACLLYTSDAADQRSSVDLGGRRFLKKKKYKQKTNNKKKSKRTRETMTMR